MPGKKLSLAQIWFLAIFTATVCLTGTRAAAQQEKVLHSFGNGKDGQAPYAGLTRDAAGNLYGVTYFGGLGKCASEAGAGCGTAFELSPNVDGGWTEKLLHNFDNNGKDGYYPAASLILDSSGNLYGTTAYGGTGVCSNAAPLTGCGTVFELSPKTGGGWGEKVLYSFVGGASDGETPSSSLIFDAVGNLYGTTGGCTGDAFSDCGTVFELSPHKSGSWSEKVLHEFSSTGSDGYEPYGKLLFDAAGNLYGGTNWGGAYTGGVAFELSPDKSGSWTENILYNFYWGKGTNGGGPAGLIFDAAGNLYGASTKWGQVFELTRASVGSWTSTTLATFDVFLRGYNPNPGLLFDDSGNLYGTAQAGGDGTEKVCEISGCGTVFELTPGSSGWTLSTLHSFGDGSDGQAPYAGLIRDAAGNFYGTTVAGGTHGAGTVFGFRP